MEICISTEGVVLKKYYFDNELVCMTEELMEVLDDACIDLESEKTAGIRHHINEIQRLLKPQNLRFS